MQIFMHSNMGITKRYFGLKDEEIKEAYDLLKFQYSYKLKLSKKRMFDLHKHSFYFVKTTLKNSICKQTYLYNAPYVWQAR
jgi:hypothetical protein